MRILWLKTELLHPVDRGGRIRTYAMLRALLKDHDITYAALDDGRSAPDAASLAREYATDVVTFPHPSPTRRSVGFALQVARNLASPLPFSAWRFRSPAMRQWVESASRARRYDVIVADFLFPTVNLPDSSATPVVLFQHNVESVIWRRLAETASGPARWYYGLQHRRMLEYERAQCRALDGVIAVSDADADTMRSLYGVSDIGVVPTGVDTEYFQPSPARDAAGGDIVFLGAMDWLPNEDGAAFLLNDIMPLVRRRLPDARVTIVGRNPSAELQRRARGEPGVTVTGTVPDVRPFLENASVFVVPLRIGGGTRLKIYEGMAMELPVVSTTIGAEGLPVENGEHLLIADGATAMAEAIGDILTDPARGSRLGRQAARLVRERYSWQRSADRFATLCQDAVLRHDHQAPSPVPSLPN